MAIAKSLSAKFHPANWLAVLFAYLCAALIVLLIYIDHFGRIAGDYVQDAFTLLNNSRRKRDAIS